MSYMWNEFNIKTFAAETIVYRDGKFCPDLSTLNDDIIDKKHNLPVHVIYVGEIAGECRLDLNNSAEDQDVFLDVRVKNKIPAFLNIFIKNTGKNSVVRGHVLLENNDNITYVCNAQHGAENTGILIQTNLLAGAKSVSKLSGAAIIEKNCIECISDISFSAMADDGARIEFKPSQYISAVPETAGHSASLYRPAPNQMQYLRESGMDTAGVNSALREAFINNFTLF